MTILTSAGSLFFEGRINAEQVGLVFRSCALVNLFCSVSLVLGWRGRIRSDRGRLLGKERKLAAYTAGTVSDSGKSIVAKVTIAVPIMTNSKRSFIYQQSNVSNGQFALSFPTQLRGPLRRHQFRHQAIRGLPAGRWRQDLLGEGTRGDGDDRWDHQDLILLRVRCRNL
jgi:hypothetical protein